MSSDSIKTPTPPKSRSLGNFARVTNETAFFLRGDMTMAEELGWDDPSILAYGVKEFSAQDYIDFINGMGQGMNPTTYSRGIDAVKAYIAAYGHNMTLMSDDTFDGESETETRKLMPLPDGVSFDEVSRSFVYGGTLMVRDLDEEQMKMMSFILSRVGRIVGFADKSDFRNPINFKYEMTTVGEVLLQLPYGAPSQIICQRTIRGEDIAVDAYSELLILTGLLNIPDELSEEEVKIEEETGKP